MKDGTYRRLSINTLLVFIGKGGSALVSLLMLPLYTHWLSPSDYGTVDLVNTYSTILLSIASCCIAEAMFVVPKGSSHEDCCKFFSSGFAFIVLQSLLMLFMSIFLFDKNQSFLFKNIWEIVTLTISMMLANMMQQFTRTIDKMKVFSFSGILHTLSIALLSLILIPAYGLSGYIDSLIISNVLVAVFVFITARLYNYVYIKKIEIKCIKQLMAYSLPLVPNSIMWWLVNGLNRPIMEVHIGLSAIGLYAVAIRFPSVIISLCDVFMNAYGISLIEEYGKDTFKSFFNTTYKMCIILVILCAFILVVFSKEIIGLFASKEFLEAWRLLPILSLGVVFSCASTIVGGIFIARKESKCFLYSSLWGAFSSVLCTYVFVKLWGLTGCAIATAVSFLIIYIVRLYYAWPDIKGIDIKNSTINYLILLLTVIFSLLVHNVMVKMFFVVLFVTLFIAFNYTFLISLKKQLLIIIKNQLIK